eukprot:gene30985-40315_t
MYLDFGTNVGIQIRKLYEPSLFPGAKALKFFNETFGTTDTKSICAVGFEPNEIHSTRLEEIEKSYREVGFPCAIFTETAVYSEEKILTFYRDGRYGPQNHEWGASLIPWQGAAMKKSGYEVLAMNTCNFLHVLLHKWRTVNYKESLSRILVKMDIEGAEFTVLPNLLFLGCLCYLNTVIIEWHDTRVEDRRIIPKDIKEMVKTTEKYANRTGCYFHMPGGADDESYKDAQFPLPHKQQLENVTSRAIMRRILLD